MKTIKETVEDPNFYNTELGSEIVRLNATPQGSIQECRCCGKSHRVEGWYFYRLCDDCCNEFKWQEKGSAHYEVNGEKVNFYSCNDWIAFKKENREVKLNKLSDEQLTDLIMSAFNLQGKK